MKGLYFYKLLSPYQDDVTKECKLTINEIDHNFITLKNTDIDSVNFDEETSLLTLNQINGDKFVTKIDLSHFTKDFNVEWNKEQSSLVFNFDDKEIVIDEIVGDVVDKSMTDIVNHIISQTITDNTLVGVGIGSNPLRLNPLEIPGTYKSVECLINIIDGEELPNKEQLSKGDRYLTYEKLNLVFLNNEIYLIKTKSSNLYSYYNLNNSFFCLLSEKLINKAKYVAFTVLDYSVSESRETNVFCNSLVSLDNNCCEDFTIENKIFYSHPKDKQVLNNFLQNIPNEFKERVFYDYWDLIKEIGKGAFGKVFYGTKKGNPKTKAAIKLVKKVELYPQDVEFLNWELDVFAFLSHQEHPNLIKAIDKFEDPNYIYLLYEFISNSDIGSYIKQYKNEIKLTNIYSMSLDLITTIDYLHNFGIIHRDIKPDNILIRNIDDNGNIDIVLIDFGFSKVLPLNEKTNDICGSPVYLAPEILYNKPYNHLADIWSFGMTLYHLVYGELPFLNTNKDYLLKQYELINQKGFDIWKDNDEEMIHKRNKKNDVDPQLEFFKKVISKCLIPEYEKRISTKELIKLYQENVDLFEEGCITCY
jgi:hypothetical protein